MISLDSAILLDPKHIAVLVDDAGNILEVSKRLNGFAYSIVKDLSDAGNLKTFFGLKPDDRISAAVKDKKTLFAQPDKFDLSTGVDNFYSTLPVVSVRFYEWDNGLFLGNIHISAILPNVFEKSTSIQCYLNTQEQLIGFNQVFFEIFKAGHQDPRSILQKSFKEFITPTPAMLQAQLLAGVQRPSHREWEEAYCKNFLGTGIDAELEVDDPGDFSAGPDGLSWRANKSYGSFLTLPIPVDISKKDVTVKLSIESESGEYPFLILGDRGEAGSFRDSKGYLVGFLDREFFLKRQGFFITRSEPVSDKVVTDLSFTKIGNAVFASCNSKEVFAYYLFDRIERGLTDIILFLRPGYRCRLKKVSVAVHSTDTLAKSEDLLVQTTGPNTRFFLLNRFDSYFTSGMNGQVSGWRLHDITELQKKTAHFEAQYRRELAESERLKRLAGRFSLDPDEPVGSSKLMATTLEMAGRAAESTATVLLTGATGVGKEVFARYIHSSSGFRDGPFIKVDCSSIPQPLMESELFGYEKGAFTGADRSHEGLFERANNGTLFLDEVGNLPPATQIKLLQFLQDFTINRLGGTVPRKLTTRLIAATNADLADMVKKGLFREDLYYRIAVVAIALPALKDRLDDLPDLCRYFLNQFNRMNNKNIRSISSNAYARLYNYSWPGNIRELKNVIERAVIFCDQAEILPEHIILPEAEGNIPENGSSNARRRKEKTSVDVSRSEMEALLKKNGGVVLKVARELGVSPRSMYYAFAKMGIDPNGLRKNPHKRN